MRSSLPLAVFLVLVLGCAREPSSEQDEKITVKVAVAANFLGTCERIAEEFRAETGTQVVLTSGSTGSLFAQIQNGAPFDVFLAADEERPRKLAEAGDALATSRFPYALGRLVLCGVGLEGGGSGEEVLQNGTLQKLAIARPEAAPYGAAAMQVLERMHLLPRLEPRIVWAENISQAFHYVASESAELGFVALAQWKEAEAAGSVGGMPPAWLVPAELHEPIRQEVVLLNRGRSSPEAEAFLEFLRGARARSLITAAGYAVPELEEN